VKLRASLGAVLLASAIGVPARPARAEPPEGGGWRSFKATWTLSGQRFLLPTEGARSASIVILEGPLVITKGQGLGRGLLGEVLVFDDGGALIVGRAVFTDERGDRIFCTLTAEPIGTGRHATATITGGTGHFAGLEGSFSFAWQYVVGEAEGELSGRAVDIEGRTRPGPRGGGAP
jgi:hypothetical protein